MDTPRNQLRDLIRARYSMDTVDYLARQGRIGEAARSRYERLWAVSTATEHRYTAAWSLDRWSSRRAAVTRAVRAALNA